MRKVSFIGEFGSIAEGYQALNTIHNDAEIFEATHTMDGRFYIFGETSQPETLDGYLTFEDADRKIAKAMLGLETEPLKESMTILEAEKLADLIACLSQGEFQIHEILTGKSTGGKSVAFVNSSSRPESPRVKVTELRDLNSHVKSLF